MPELLKALLETNSVSGYEEEAQALVKKELAAYAEEISNDATGNLIAVINRDAAKRILLTAHIDEIGLIVSRIDNEGFLHVQKAGGITPNLYLGQPVKIKTAERFINAAVLTNEKLNKKEELKVEDLLLDIGCKSKADAEQYVKVGDPIAADFGLKELTNGRFCGRALDDRLGVYIIIEVLKRLKGCKLKNAVYAVSAVGEETTSRGAYWAAQRIKPDLAIAVDVTYTNDYDSDEGSNAPDVALGKGPVLCHGSIVDKKVNAYFAKLAAALKIKLQYEVASSRTGTDADEMHFTNNGVKTVLVSIPLRYMHSAVEVADSQDAEAIITLLVEFLKNYSFE